MGTKTRPIALICWHSSELRRFCVNRRRKRLKGFASPSADLERVTKHEDRCAEKRPLRWMKRFLWLLAIGGAALAVNWMRAPAGDAGTPMVTSQRNKALRPSPGHPRRRDTVRPSALARVKSSTVRAPGARFKALHSPLTKSDGLLLAFGGVRCHRLSVFDCLQR